MPILAADLVDFAMLSEFIALISTPSLKAVAAHWDAVRGARRMPSWEDLQPKAIGSQLAIAWSLKYDRADGSFTSPRKLFPFTEAGTATPEASSSVGITLIFPITSGTVIALLNPGPCTISGTRIELLCGLRLYSSFRVIKWHP